MIAPEQRRERLEQILFTLEVPDLDQGPGTKDQGGDLLKGNPQ